MTHMKKRDVSFRVPNSVLEALKRQVKPGERLSDRIRDTLAIGIPSLRPMRGNPADPTVTLSVRIPADWYADLERNMAPGERPGNVAQRALFKGLATRPSPGPGYEQ